MSNPQMYQSSSKPLYAAQEAVAKILQTALEQTTPRTQQLIQAALQNGGKITLEAEIFPTPVYRFYLNYEGRKTPLTTVFLDETSAESETVH